MNMGTKATFYGEVVKVEGKELKLKTIDHGMLPLKTRLANKVNTGDILSYKLRGARMIAVTAAPHMTNLFNQSNRPFRTESTLIPQSQLDFDEESVFERHGIVREFPNHVEDEATQLASMPITDDEIAKRIDLRKMTTISIDPATAKDRDDAISITRLNNGNWLLGVHIADVAHYVGKNTATYQEALNRGTSIYPPSDVIPMLPHALSSGVCSPTENHDNLTISTFITVDPEGNILSRSVKEGIINVDKNFSYDQVSEILNDGPILGQDRVESDGFEYLPLLQQFQDITNKIAEKRKTQGNINFDVPEPTITKNERGEVLSINARPREAGDKIVENMMVLTNGQSAEMMQELGLPNIYRNHEELDITGKIQFIRTLEKFNVTHNFNLGNINTNTMSAFMDKLDETTLRRVSPRAVMSMERAEYGVTNGGHFGLGLEGYTHTTSPIRRFPDLVYQHLVKDYVIPDKKLDADERLDLEEELRINAFQANKTQERATAIEREIEYINMLKFMSEQNGEIFQGHICDINEKGVRVKLDNTVEGFIGFDQFPTVAYFDGKKSRIITQDGNLRHGSRLRLQVLGIDKNYKLQLTARDVDQSSPKHKEEQIQEPQIVQEHYFKPNHRDYNIYYDKDQPDEPYHNIEERFKTRLEERSYD
ncbi:MAG: RNB domain-containing ribonuclease [Firmicutes bacterium]|nr:RNB domain-containing ribonuclease [Bacillota bacterium]